MSEVQGIAYLLTGLMAAGLVAELARAAIWMGLFAFLFRKPIRAFVRYCKHNS